MVVIMNLENIQEVLKGLQDKIVGFLDNLFDKKVYMNEKENVDDSVEITFEAIDWYNDVG